LHIQIRYDIATIAFKILHMWGENNLLAQDSLIRMAWAKAVYYKVYIILTWNWPKNIRNENFD